MGEGAQGQLQRRKKALEMGVGGPLCLAGPFLRVRGAAEANLQPVLPDSESGLGSRRVKKKNLKGLKKPGVSTAQGIMGKLSGRARARAQRDTGDKAVGVPTTRRTRAQGNRGEENFWGKGPAGGLRPIEAEGGSEQPRPALKAAELGQWGIRKGV